MTATAQVQRQCLKVGVCIRGLEVCLDMEYFLTEDDLLDLDSDILSDEEH